MEHFKYVILESDRYGIFNMQAEKVYELRSVLANY